MKKKWEAEFSRRFARHEDELKWLYGELYHGDMQAYDYFVSMLYRAYCGRPEALRELDRVREAEGVIVSRRVARLLKHSAFSGMGREVKLPVFDPYTRLPKFMQLDPEIAQSSLNEIVSGGALYCASTSIPCRRKRSRPRVPMVIITGSASSSASRSSTVRMTLLLNPPHRPLLLVMTI